MRHGVSKCDGSCGKCQPGIFSPCDQCGHPQDHDFGGCWHPDCHCRVYSFPLV